MVGCLVAPMSERVSLEAPAIVRFGNGQPAAIRELREVPTSSSVSGVQASK